LVAGPRVYICDACVSVAKRIMEDDAPGHEGTAGGASPLLRRLLGVARRLLRGGARCEALTTVR